MRPNSSGILLFIFTLLHLATATYSTTRIHTIHWNSSNPIFKLDHDSNKNVIAINGGNHPWEYDQVNLVCPVYKPGASGKQEQYIIYSVTKEEYESCRITQPNPKIVALCNRPYELMYFTITFRSFTPTPGGLEFRPGQDYYFISTSSQNDIHRRVGGGCSANNMKVIFKVAPDEHSLNEVEGGDSNSVSDDVIRPVAPQKQFPWSQESDFRRTFSYYYPARELKEQTKKSAADYTNLNEEVKQQASVMPAESSNSAGRSLAPLNRILSMAATMSVMVLYYSL